MSNKSAIEWTNTTWNPVRGCVKVSPGCKNCYAETFANRWRGIVGHPYEQGFNLRLVPEKLFDPLKWNKPLMVFVNSMSDLFQDGVPFEYVDRCFAMMALCPQHTFQILTKRPERMLEYVSGKDREAIVFAEWELTGCATRKEWTGRTFPVWPLPNVWLGVSAEDQSHADDRVRKLLRTPAAKRFVSYEPALGPVDFSHLCGGTYDALHGTDFEDLNVWPPRHPHLDWVIVGGESGPGARPFDIEWARSIVRQCKEAEVACFVKQLGSHPFSAKDRIIYRSKDRSALANPKMPDGFYRILNSSKGGDMSEWPEDLRVREFPV